MKKNRNYGSVECDGEKLRQGASVGEAGDRPKSGTKR